MKKNTVLYGFLVELLALVVVAIIVHAAYVTYIRPRADDDLAARRVFVRDDGFATETEPIEEADLVALFQQERD